MSEHVTTAVSQGDRFSIDRKTSELLAFYGELAEEGIRRELDKARKETAENLLRLAVLLRICEERKYEVEGIPINFRQRLLRVAYGQAVPDLLAGFWSRPFLFDRISRLPIPDQQRIAADKPIAVVERDDQGVTHRLLAPSQMDDDQIKQVLAGDHIREDQAEQLRWIDQQNQKREKTRATKPRGPYEIDAKHRVVIIHQPIKLHARDLLKMLEELDG